MSVQSVEERLASIEATLPHLATKSDVVELLSELKTMRWFIAVGIVAAGVVVQFLDKWIG